MKVWRSQHRNCKEDRIHYFGCGYGPMTYSERDCSWSYYANEYDQPLNFKCHYNGFIAGVHSVFAGGIDDRRYSMLVNKITLTVPDNHCS